jgi:hypothetical protein
MNRSKELLIDRMRYVCKSNIEFLMMMVNSLHEHCNKYTITHNVRKYTRTKNSIYAGCLQKEAVKLQIGNKNERGLFLYSDQNEYGNYLYSDQNVYGHFLYSDQNICSYSLYSDQNEYSHFDGWKMICRFYFI